MNPIVTVNLMGGLGNQLFQIAAGLSYARKWGGRFLLYRKTDNGNRPVYWDTLLSSMTPYLVEQPFASSLPSWSEVDATVYSEPPALTSRGLHLQGYLQSSNYYTEESANEIRRLFQQPPPSEPRLPVEQFLLDHKERVVVIHARRTDYLKFREVHGPLEGGYYRRAIDRMLQHIPNPIFLLTSDDPAFWTEIASDLSAAKQHPVLTIDFPYSDIRAFRLLQQFQHFIMSNSTFIWWCAWLAKDVKHVLAPTRWFGPAGPAQYEDIYESSWERICSDP